MKETHPPSNHHHHRRSKGGGGEADHHHGETIRVWDCGSPLYDSYELVSLSHVIDRNIMVSPCLSGSRKERSSRFSHAPLFSSSTSRKADASSVASSAKKTKEEEEKKGFRVPCFAVTFLTGLLERNNNALKRRTCGVDPGEEEPNQPFIEEFNYPMPRDGAGGGTGVLVNGRELHPKDLKLLGSRGLPTDNNRSFILDISGRVLDADTGEVLESLGKLAPT